MEKVFLNIFLTPAYAFVGPEANFFANFSASSMTFSSGTTELIRPHSKASFEDKTLFVSINSIVLFFPIERGKWKVELASGVRPAAV